MWRHTPLITENNLFRKGSYAQSRTRLKRLSSSSSSLPRSTWAKTQISRMLAVFFWSWIILCKLLSTKVPYFLWLKIKDALQMTKDRDNKKGFLILGTDKISQVYSSKNSTNRLLKADTHPDISPIWALQQHCTTTVDFTHPSGSAMNHRAP